MATIEHLVLLLINLALVFEKSKKKICLIRKEV